MIATRSPSRDGAIQRAASELAQLLRLARMSFPQSARVCPRCHHVFSRDSRLDMRCPECARATADAETVLP